jgi:hypothetical protein
LVGDGFAVLDVDVVLAVFIGFAVFDVVVVAVFETVVVLLFVAAAVFDTEVVALEFDIVLVLFALALALFAVSPPQAIPNALRPKSAESAIAFFMLKTFSCLLQRLI